MYQRKWYLSSWVIAVCFTFSFLVVPAILGIVLLIMQMKEDKKIKQDWENSGFGDIVQARYEKERLEKEHERLKMQGKAAESQLQTLNQEIGQKKKEIIVLDDEILYQEFGFYNPRYDFQSSAQYAQRLDETRDRQKEMVKNNTATIHSENWTVDGSKSKGQSLNKNNIKLTLRAFNNECDAAITKAKFNNIDSIEKRIRKAYDTLNNLNKHNRIEIKSQYLELKLQELYLAYEYEKMKEMEKEEQRRIKEQMREEQKALQEINRMKEKIEKEESHFKQALTKLHTQLEQANESEKSALQEKIRELQEQLAEVQQSKEDVLRWEQNTRAGYVYIISNIGSFGEDVYKIGMTRRLEPLDRVKELGDASVPFTFDVHAMIFSEDAPALENALHRSFADKRMNLVNERKEFFKVSLHEIEDIVKQNHNKTVEFTKLAEAEEYRRTLQFRKEPQKVALPV